MTHQKTILIIDDESFIRESLTFFFEDEGYLVFSAEDGKIGLNIFFNENIDLVLTDLRMPEMDGIDVMKSIQEYKPDTPMIVVSGAGKKNDIIKALRIGAKDYITKPIKDFDMMNHTVKQVLENKRLNDENRRYREKLEKSENQYRNITENIAEGVFTVDEFENFTYTNQAFCTMIGYSSEGILQKNLKDITTENNFTIIQKQTQNRHIGLTDRYEIQLIDNKKQSVHVELACSPILGEKNKYQGAIAVVRDITKVILLRKKFQKFLSSTISQSKDVLPICANCKSIRKENDGWIPVEDHFSDIIFSHGMCPECCEKLYPELDISDLD